MFDFNRLRLLGETGRGGRWYTRDVRESIIAKRRSCFFAYLAVFACETPRDRISVGPWIGESRRRRVRIRTPCERYVRNSVHASAHRRGYIKVLSRNRQVGRRDIRSLVAAASPFLYLPFFPAVSASSLLSFSLPCALKS